jgi:hypothetical protein
VVVLQGRVELVRSVDAAPIDDHHDLFAGGAEGRHHLVDILAQLLGIKVWDDFIEDFRRAILDGADDTEQHAAGDPAPRAGLHPQTVPQDALRPRQLLPTLLAIQHFEKQSCGEATE